MIAVIGGTGKLGRGLVSRLAVAGYDVIIGSRTPEKAERVAGELTEKTEKKIKGDGNLEAVQGSEIVFLSIPASAIEKIIKGIFSGLESGNLVVSVVVPITREKDKFTVQESDVSAAEKISSEVPDGVSVTSAFQVVPANNLQKLEKPLDSDVPICGDDPEAKEKVAKIIEDISGARPIDAGPLSNSSLVETTAAFLVDLTRIHGNETSIRFKGI